MKKYDVDENLPHSLAMEYGAVEKDDRLAMYEDHVKLLEAEKKTTTIRFRRGLIRCPAPGDLPLFETRPSDKSYEKLIGKIRIDSIVVKRFIELESADAERDGFSSKEELKEKLKEIYGSIKGHEFVSIYNIESFHLDRGG